jgi:hypothetical protein
MPNPIPGGYAELGAIYFQLRATETLQARGANYVFDLDIRDYNIWLMEELMNEPK